MATSVVEHTSSTNATFLCQSLDLQALNAGHASMEEKVGSESLSTFNASSGSPALFTRESVNPSYSVDASAHIQDKFTSSPLGDGDKSRLHLDQSYGTSCAGGLTRERNIDDFTYQKRPDADVSSQSFLNSSLDSHTLSRASTSDTIFESKWDFSKDYSNFTFDKPTTTPSSIFKSSKPNCGQLSTCDVKLDDYPSKYQTFDFELMKQTYNFKSSTNLRKLEEKQSDSMNMSSLSRQYTDFDSSDMALKLRSSVQSNFLSNELRQENPSKTEASKSEPAGALRTIEAILKQYGISDNVPALGKQPVDDEKKLFSASSNVSQGNDSSLSLSRPTSSARTITQSSTQDQNTAKMFPSSANINSLFVPDLKTNSSYLDFKNLTNTNAGYSFNTSQNNETTLTSNSVNDPLKKTGSSVDYSSSVKLGAYPGSSSFQKYNYGKATSFTGDNSRATTNPFASIETRQFEGNAEKIKFEGSQVDIGNPTFDLSKSTPLDIIKNMGSATDALEYSMSSERQRLRKLDTIISATPFNYSSVELPSSLRAKYMSPERSYSTLRSSDLPGRKMYSSSNIPSSSGYATGFSHKSNMAGTSIALNKSISAPRNAKRNARAAGRYDSSVDARPSYWTYSSNDYNRQYNNVYNPQLLEKLASDKNGSKPQSKAVTNKKKECPLKNKKDAPDSHYSNSRDNKSVYAQSATGISFLNNVHLDKNSAAERKRYGVKQDTKKCVGGKKTSATDFNQSKNIPSMYDGYDFVKDLNRMWQDTVFRSASSTKSAQNKKQPKYTPYKPATSSSDKKEKSGDTRDVVSRDFGQSLSRGNNNGWTSGGCGKYNIYDNDLKFQSGKQCQGQCSVEPQRSSQPKSKMSGSSLVKQKSSVTSEYGKKQTTTAPKSILKQPTRKSTSSTSTDMRRPQSAMVSSTTYHQPYQLIRGFSPVDLHKPSRTNLSTSSQKANSSTKKRPLSATCTISKPGRRV